MANSSNKNATKSLVMLIVTGVVLVAVTLCWFVINKKTSVDSLGSAVNNDASSTAKLYYGVKNQNGDIAVDRETLIGYKEVSEDIIKLENMVPGSEYFYVAVFESCSAGRVITLDFTDVVDYGLAEVITVYCEAIKNSTSIVTTDKGFAQAEAMNQLGNGSVTVCEKEIKSSEEAGRYFVYFSFKFDEDATIGGEDIGDGTTSVDYRNKSVTIGSVDTAVSSITNEETTPEETSSEMNNENS